MILVIQLILICVLVLILLALYIDEGHKRRLRVPTGRLAQFWDGSERRRFVRISANVPVRYNLSLEPDGEGAIKTSDISIGGICITLSEKLKPKQQLAVEIDLPGADKAPIFAKGRVAWIKEKGGSPRDGIRHFTTGIEFREISRNGMSRLLDFIKEACQPQMINGENKGS